MLLTESKRIKLKVDRIEPANRTAKEFYIEQEFKLDTKGTFIQMVLFSQRVSQLQRILRIESFNLKTAAVPDPRISNLLDGQFTIKAYQYAASKEDEMAGAYK